MTLQTTEIGAVSKCPTCNQEIVGISASKPGEHYYTCGHEATNHILSNIIPISKSINQLEGGPLKLFTGMPASILSNTMH